MPTGVVILPDGTRVVASSGGNNRRSLVVDTQERSVQGLAARAAWTQVTHSSDDCSVVCIFENHVEVGRAEVVNIIDDLGAGACYHRLARQLAPPIAGDSFFVEQCRMACAELQNGNKPATSIEFDTRDYSWTHLLLRKECEKPFEPLFSRIASEVSGSTRVILWSVWPVPGVEDRLKLRAGSVTRLSDNDIAEGLLSLSVDGFHE